MSSKHLTLIDRCMIEKYLAFGYSFREIATALSRQPSTISREVQKYRTFITPKQDSLSAKCSKLDSAPFVCNQCPSQDFCNREHAYYQAHKANAKSKTILSQSRSFLHVDENEIKRLNDLVSPLIKNGQSFSHIYSAHADEIGLCRRTMYHYVDKCVFEARNIDLPRSNAKVKATPYQRC